MTRSAVRICPAAPEKSLKPQWFRGFFLFSVKRLFCRFQQIFQQIFLHTPLHSGKQLHSAADTTGSTDGSSDGSESYDDGSGDSGSTISNSAGFTDEQLSNTDETRTIYRNSDGHPLVITPDGNGSWVDFDGNTYNFTSDEDAYDENGTSYYWHGEGADVYYMPVPQ